MRNADCGMRNAEFLQCRMRIAECGIDRNRRRTKVRGYDLNAEHPEGTRMVNAECGREP